MRTHPRRHGGSFNPGMTPADYDDIKLLHGSLRLSVGVFHVEQSFPDAEPPEQRVEHILGGGPPEERIE
jgi:hypothetical protein